MESVPKGDIESLVTIRSYKPEDKAFIIATWLRGYYYGEKAIGEIEKSAFMENYNKRLNLLIDSGRLNIKLACLKEDPEVILSYAVMSPNEKALHWVFSKAAWRKIGLSKKLIPATIDSVTHLTQVARSILKKYADIKYNPFLL